MEYRTRDGEYVTLDMEAIRREARAMEYEKRYRLVEATGRTYDEVEYALFTYDGDEGRARGYLEGETGVRA